MSKQQRSFGPRTIIATPLAVLLTQAGCLAPVGDDAPGDVQVTQDAVAGGTERADLVSTIDLNPGSWGTWSAARYCAPGSFAVGYRMRVEKNQGSNDDSALNAVELECMNGQGNVSPVLAHDGSWGDWNDSTYCTDGGFITGGAVRFESSQGSGDDTAGNDVRMRCTNGDIQAPGGGSSGAWTTAKTCPASTSVCGISVRFESSQGSGDDTALNAVRLACCTNPAPSSRLRVRERTVDGIKARTFSPDAGPAKAPLLLVEGFDVDGTNTLDTLIGELPAGFVGTLADLGYSATIVDLAARNSESIQSNARRVGLLANQIWADSARTNPIKLVGASMGGLVVATAAAMKDNWATLGEANPGWSFKVDHVTAIDSPHAGAYIPQAIFHVLSRFQSLNSTAGARYRSLTSVASKQMSMIPYDSSFESTHATWQAYYDNVLRIMRKSDMRFVSVVDGSWTGALQNANWTSGALNVYWTKRSTALDVDAWLYTQPTPGTRVARIKTNWALTSTEDKTYNAYPGNWPIVENTAGGTTTHWKDVAKALDSNLTPTYPNQSFVPTWSAAGLSFQTYMSLPADQRASMAVFEAARGPVVGSALSPFDRILYTAANNKHATIPAAVLEAFVEELRVAATPPAYAAVWTAWMNRDNPSGNGDGEHLGLMMGVPCKAPLTAECRRASDGVDWSRTGEVVRCSANGSECLNAEQPDGTCDDYEVRFACPVSDQRRPVVESGRPVGQRRRRAPGHLRTAGPDVRAAHRHRVPDHGRRRRERHGRNDDVPREPRRQLPQRQPERRPVRGLPRALRLPGGGRVDALDEPR